MKQISDEINHNCLKKVEILDSTSLLKRAHSTTYGALEGSKANFGSKLSEKKGTCVAILDLLKTLTIEPIVFCFMFAYAMNIGVLPNLMMDIGCPNHFNYSLEVCADLSQNPIEKKNVEILASDFAMYLDIMTVWGALCMMLIAPWSDKYGRKLPLFCGVAGFILMYVGIILCIVFNARLEYLIIAKTLAETFGGLSGMVTIFYTYASEVSSKKDRTLKCTSVEIFYVVGNSLGGLTAGYLYQSQGYIVVYIIASSLCAFCLFWDMLVLVETVKLENDISWWKKLKDFFTSENALKAFKAAFRKREGNRRVLLLMLVMSLCVAVVVINSFSSLNYLYVHHIYNWGPATYNTVHTLALLVQTATTVLVVVPIFIKIFKIKDFTLGLIGLISLMVKNLTIAFASYHVAIFLAGQFCDLFGSIVTVIIRSSISKLVDKDELGQVFSFMATSKVIMSMLGTVIFTQIFDATIDVTPSVMYCVVVVMLFLPFFTFIWATTTRRNLLSTSGTQISKNLLKENT